MAIVRCDVYYVLGVNWATILTITRILLNPNVAAKKFTFKNFPAERATIMEISIISGGKWNFLLRPKMLFG